VGRVAVIALLGMGSSLFMLIQIEWRILDYWMALALLV
jgi:hypothetical protein